MTSNKVTDSSFEADVIKSEKPVLVDFWANGVDHAYKLPQRSRN
ncbi:MAG: hypothetical protein CM1200mP4_4990 [Rhodospirillaceae bacterium]|nr:MAG: hypothetical protein CM1200mP4_4990 [Rhodospirillaceae bacterium]